MAGDRIVQLSVRGFRCLGNIELDLNGLQVLIGDNGSGKSTVVEALELLHQLAGSATTGSRRTMPCVPQARSPLSWSKP